MAYGVHIDNPIMRRPVPMRLDLSITAFLSDPDHYTGGELCIEMPYGEKRIKLPAGDAVLDPTTKPHRVVEVTSGERLAARHLDPETMVHEQAKRSMLYDLAVVTQWAHSVAPESPNYHRLNNTRANLTRMWAID